MERLSTQTQESGFVSIHSQRSSTQSYNTSTNLISKRSSQQSSVSYNSQSQSYFQHRLSSSENNGSMISQKTISSSKSSSHSSCNMSNAGDPATFMEKLVIVGVVLKKDIFFFIIYFISDTNIDFTIHLSCVIAFLGCYIPVLFNS